MAKQQWDLIVIDVSLPDADGFSVLTEIRKCHPTAPVVALSGQTDLRHAARAKRMGASGYAGKDGSHSKLVSAIRDVLGGKDHFTGFGLPEDTEIVLPSLDSLSPREYAVMLALGAGKRITDIAAELQLSSKTIGTYKHRLLKKLKLRSVAELVRFLIDHNIS